MPENVGALSLASADETFPLASFDQLQKLRWVESPEFTLSTDFGISADVSIFGTGLDWLFLLINWTKRKVLKDKALLYINEYE